MNTIKLPEQFVGTGEVKDFEFTLYDSNSKSYMYEIKNEGNIHYEVFKRKTTPVCIDFENRIYSETEVKEIYPKAKDFGVWAWTFRDKANARLKLAEIWAEAHLHVFKDDEE